MLRNKSAGIFIMLRSMQRQDKEENKEKERVFKFNMLPDDCVSTVLSFISPLDACRSSLVSSTFRSTMESDDVWEKFLPSDYGVILSRILTPLNFSSKKELYIHLCNSVLIDGGKKSFKLEKSSGKKSYILSARELFIMWSDVPTYWSWIPTTESRFSEVAVLRTTWWLEIQGKIRTQMLSPNTKYGAYLIMKISNRAYGLDFTPSKISVEVGNYASFGIAYLQCQNSKERPNKCLDDDMNHTQMEETTRKYTDAQMPRERNDSWYEIEMGEFFSGEFDAEVQMNLMEVNGCRLKGGLIIDGIEVRPKY